MPQNTTIKQVFPEADYYVQNIRCEDCLEGKFSELVNTLAGTDDLAAHLAAGADYVIMHRRMPPPDGTIFVKLFDGELDVSERDAHVYRNWYPMNKFLFLANDGRHHCWLKDYLDGKPLTAGTFKLQ
jgi:hypothetical protein